MGPGWQETRTQETFGAAAPGRRVLYSASWVLRAPVAEAAGAAPKHTPGLRGADALSKAQVAHNVDVAPQAHREHGTHALERARDERVHVVHREVCVLARLEAPLLVLLMRQPGAAEREHADRLLPAEPLGRIVRCLRH